MKYWFIMSFLFSHCVLAEIELLIVGGQSEPIQFVVLPFEYHGKGLSPAVTVESHIIQAISSTGLFSMPFRYEMPADENNLMAWQLSGIRYVLTGEIYEASQTLALNLSIADTLGLQPTLSTVILNPKKLELSSQMFADQVYRSLFYATFTNDNEKQYLDNENPTLTRYLNQLVVAFKMAWQGDTSVGSCTVDVQQMPGGVPFKSHLHENCYQSDSMAREINQALENIDILPYQQYQKVFEKNLKLQFIGVN